MRKFEFVTRIFTQGYDGKFMDIASLQKPQRSTEYSAGYDFMAIVDQTVPPYHIGDAPTLVPTGIKANMPDDEFLMLVNRSSNPKKKKLVIPNSIGIIDSDYYGNDDTDGEIFFAFYNLSSEPITIKKGEKIGQGIFMKYLTTDDDITNGKRSGGFGSTDA